MSDVFKRVSSRKHHHAKTQCCDCLFQNQRHTHLLHQPLGDANKIIGKIVVRQNANRIQSVISEVRTCIEPRMSYNGNDCQNGQDPPSVKSKQSTGNRFVTNRVWSNSCFTRLIGSGRYRCHGSWHHIWIFKLYVVLLFVTIQWPSVDAFLIWPIHQYADVKMMFFGVKMDFFFVRRASITAIATNNDGYFVIWMANVFSHSFDGTWMGKRKNESNFSHRDYWISMNFNFFRIYPRFRCIFTCWPISESRWDTWRVW